MSEILILVFSFLSLMALGVPIAYCLALSALATLSISIPIDVVATTITQQMVTSLDSFALLAIPFFILAGQIMNKGGISTRLIDFARIFVLKLPGGLALINIVAAMLFGAVAGSAAAAASAIGGFLHPKMVKDGYDPAFSAAVNISSSTTGLIIPPSNVMIVYSMASGGVSVGAMFLAGYIPGILLGLALMALSLFIAKRRNYPVSPSVKFSEAVQYSVRAIPSLFLLVIVIGGIITGIFTATEASAIAVVYTLILSIIYKNISWSDMPKLLIESVKTFAVVAVLIGTSMSLSWVMSFEHIPQNLTNLILGISENPIIVLLLINLILLFVGTFMDMTPAVLIFTPIFLPIIKSIGMDPVHFGIVMILNLCVGLCTPPVGSILFIGSSIANVRVEKVLKPLLPFFLVMVIVLLIVTYFPILSTLLPELFKQ